MSDVACPESVTSNALASSARRPPATKYPKPTATSGTKGSTGDR